VTPERWQRVGELFQTALDHDEASRAGFLDAACGSDALLRAEVDSLLAAHREAGTFGEGLRAGADDDDTGEETAAEEGRPERALQPGARLGPYEVVELIASGGMGEVYRARDGRLERDVAVKVLPPSFRGDARRLRRFHQEARSVGALNHPNIVAVYDVGMEDAVPFVVSELLEGETLRGRLDREGALPAREAAEIARQVTAGLLAAHEKAIVHRDLKPANLFLTQDGRVKILDFGLAKRVRWTGDHATSPTQPGVLLGTAAYMSPEQARGEPTDPATDLFSFGAVLFEMLTGRRAFEGPSPVETLAAVLEARPDLDLLPADVPAALHDVVRRCLEKDRSRRFGSARELLAALTALPDPSAARPSAGPERAAVAVLPFLDLDGDRSQEYLCDGLAEELIHALAGVEGLKVAARTSSFQLKGTSDGVRRIGEKLGVSRVVEGSVRRVGSRLRITVQLVDAREGYQVWSERFDRELGDVFALQDEIAARVVGALRVRLAVPPAPRPRPRDAQAWELYLKGRYFWNKRYQGELRKAVSAFEAALARDPDFAPAHAGLADACSVIGYYGLSPETEVFAQARRAAERALALDPRSPEAHVSIALVRDWFDWDLPAAEAALRRALALSSDHVPAHLYLAHVLAVQGRAAEAVASARAGAERDPLSTLAHTLVATAFYLSGDDEEALRATERALELDARYPPALLYLTLAESRRGRHEAAIAAARRGVEASAGGAVFESLQGWALGRGGQAGPAREVLAQLERRAETEYVPAVCLARVAAGLGENDRARQWLADAVRQRNTWVVNLGADPWPGLSADPRWAALLARAGIRVLREAPPARGAAAGARKASAPSVAVLPFRDHSPPPIDTHLGLGLADATITELARRGSLLVRPTSAVLRYQAGTTDAREAGRELGVDTVVEGGFQRSGERVRVTVQLVAVDDGRPLWATKLDAALADVFGMQDEVSSRIAEALQAELAPGSLPRRPPRPPSPAVYELYLRGKLALWREGLPDFIAAVDWFEKARAADPGFALAWVGLADAYARIAFEFHPEGDWYARAQAMCAHALALDPDLPEARYVRGRLLWSPPAGFEHDGAMRELLAALAGRPNLDEAHVRLATILFHVGMLDEAERSLERALALSPGHFLARLHMGSFRFHRGEFPAAREVGDAIAGHNPSYWSYYLAGQSRVRLGDLDGATAVAERMLVLGDEGTAHGHSLHAVIAARRGDLAAARRRVERAVEGTRNFGHHHHAQYDLACTHALLGEPETALGWLRDAAANGYPCHPFFAIDPLLRGLDGHPGFRVFMHELEDVARGHARAYAALVVAYGGKQAG
jgi:TolB-like protein/predicted Zn-dependent protease